MNIDERLTMTIEKYFAYFHDGEIQALQQVDNRLILSMISAEIDPDVMEILIKRKSQSQ